MYIHRILIAIVCVALGLLSGAAAATDLERPASWSLPAAAEVKTQLDDWLRGQELSDVQRAQVELLWPASDDRVSGDQLLEQVVTTVAAVAPTAKELVQFCHAPRTAAPLPEFAILNDQAQPPVVHNNLRLMYGVWLARNDLHEEALEQFGSLAPNDVADPAALLFYQSVCHHRLRDKEACLPAIAKLLERESEVPRRFREVAELMRVDLAPLEPDSLDEVARLMDSIRRRLEQARVGKRVRKEEDDVIAKLDKLIKEMEDKAGEGPASPSSNPSPSSPAEEAQPGGVRGEGNVDNKNLPGGGNWGNLPPKARQEALQQISKELPAHYREAIEEYFRKLAREGAK